MKNLMKNSFIVVLGLVSSIAMADFTTSIVVLPKKSPAIVLTYEVTQLKDVFGLKGKNLSLVGFAGVNDSTLAGFALGSNVQIASNLKGFLGAGLTYQIGRKNTLAILFGVNLKT